MTAERLEGIRKWLDGVEECGAPNCGLSVCMAIELLEHIDHLDDGYYVERIAQLEGELRDEQTIRRSVTGELVELRKHVTEVVRQCAEAVEERG